MRQRLLKSAFRADEQILDRHVQDVGHINQLAYRYTVRPDPRNGAISRTCQAGIGQYHAEQARAFLAVSSFSASAVWFAGHNNASVITAILLTWGLGAAVRFPTERFLLSNMIGTMTALFVLLLMQHSQNRDMHALQAKVDELIRAGDAGNHMVGIERVEAADLQSLIADRQAD